ncbi:MAG: helix-turn-helix transcriptional regulator [Verrucomicrobia bacterium]|nr:helix-turn-helix transcriptional regulator [Verrucomicrobiota bacterium]MDA1067428.1 helix-turn-helix transcriptional regulator [Verrucomicrobiota bacterium]
MQSKTDHLALIKSALSPFLKPNRLGSCYQIFEGKKPSNESTAYTEGRACRLILGLSGKGKFLTIEGGRESTFEISRGNSIFLASSTWISCIPEVTYKSLGIIFGQSFLRLTITQRTVKNGEVNLKYLAKWQSNRVLHIREDHVLQLLQQPNPSSLGERYVSNLLEIILYLTWDALLASEAHQPAQAQGLWQAIREYIMEHWSESTLSREQLADHFHVHPNHISRIFKTYGKTKYISFLNEVRLSRSMELLDSSSYNITDIAALCGYTDLQYYIKCFRERYGATPGEYRRLQNN